MAVVLSEQPFNANCICQHCRATVGYMNTELRYAGKDERYRLLGKITCPNCGKEITITFRDD